MHAIAWLLNDLFFDDHFWVGFLIEAVLFFIVAAIAGMVAYKRHPGGRAADPRPGDRGGQADQADAGVGDDPGREGADRAASADPAAADRLRTEEPP